MFAPFSHILIFCFWGRSTSWKKFNFKSVEVVTFMPLNSMVICKHSTWVVVAEQQQWVWVEKPVIQCSAVQTADIFSMKLVYLTSFSVNIIVMEMFISYGGDTYPWCIKYQKYLLCMVTHLTFINSAYTTRMLQPIWINDTQNTRK